MNIPLGYLTRSGCYLGLHLNTYHQDLFLIRTKRRKVTISSSNPVALIHFLKVLLFPEIMCTDSHEHQVYDCIQHMLKHVIYSFQWQRHWEFTISPFIHKHYYSSAQINSATKAYSISFKLQPSHFNCCNLFLKNV